MDRKLTEAEAGLISDATPEELLEAMKVCWDDDQIEEFYRLLLDSLKTKH